MPNVAIFPLPIIFAGVYGTADAPLWSDFLYDGVEYKTFLGAIYEDGSRDRNLESTAGVHKWTLEYNSLTEAEQLILDQHYQSAYGQTYGFNFYDHRSQTLWTNVHYQEYKRAKGKKRSRALRKVVLVCEPS